MTVKYLDPNDLVIESNDQGFVLGVSLVGDTVTDDANAWRTVNCDFTGISLEYGVSLDKGVLFRPEAAQLSLRTSSRYYMSGIFGKQIRIFWKGELLFSGEIQTASLVSTAGADESKTIMNISVLGTVQKAINYVLYNFDAPAQTVAQRVARAAEGLVGVPVTAIASDRLMPARLEASPKLMEVLQDAADVQMARFYTDKANNIIVDGTLVTEPSAVFSDDHTVPNHLEYNNVNMIYSNVNSITAAFVKPKQTEASYGRIQHPNATMTHEETYEIDLPNDASSILAWLLSFPLRGFAQIEPTSISTYWQDEFLDLELTDLISVRWEGHTYESVIIGISYEIIPDRDYGLRWTAKFNLAPGHIVNRTNYTAPSPPETVTATMLSASSIRVDWTRPVQPGNMTGYVVRYAAGGQQVPRYINEGQDGGTYPLGTTTATINGLTSYTNYGFSVFAVTDTPGIVSAATTASTATDEIVPSAPTAFNVTKTYDDVNQPGYMYMWHNTSWAAPTSGNTGSYFLAWNYNGTNPTTTSYSDSSGAHMPTIQLSLRNQINFNAAERNKNIRYALWARSPKGVYGPPTYFTLNSNEVTPSVPSVTLELLNSYNAAVEVVKVTWTGQPTSSFDFIKSELRWWSNGGGPPSRTQGTLHASYSKSSTREAYIEVPRNQWLDVSVFAVTHGDMAVRGSAFVFVPALQI